MSNRNKGKIADELDNRLDDLFSDDGGADAADAAPVKKPAAKKARRKPPSPPPSGSGSGGTESELMQLHATVLSLDWEITDTTLDRLNSEIDRLKNVYSKNKLPYMFLQLLGSVGKYISTKKVKAHPDSIKLLHSVYIGLEKVLTDTGLPDVEKKKILSNEVRKFKSLKQQIRLTKSTEAEASQPARVIKTAEAPSPEPEPAPAPSGVDDSLPFAGEPDEDTLLNAIRRLIRSEIQQMKAEILAKLDEMKGF